MKRKFKRLITRVGVLAMAGTLCVALMPDLTRASALESLSHIESIKQDKIESQEPFRVLELVPAEGMGSLGYYVAGQEPTADWLQKLAVIDNNTATEGTNDREATANAMLQKLKNAGLLGEAVANTPLTLVGDYKEYLPWEEVPTDVTAQELDLVDEDGEPRKEKADVKGVFQPAEDGSFDRVVVPTWAEDDEGKPNGSYNQKVEHFVRAQGQGTDANPADPGGVYYYVPTFAEVTPDTTVAEENQYDDYVGKAIYQLETLPAGEDGEEGGDSSGSDGTEEPAEQITYYVYRGTLGQDGFAIDTNETYYYVVTEGRPYQTYEAAVEAAAEADNANPGGVVGNADTTGTEPGTDATEPTTDSTESDTDATADTTGEDDTTDGEGEDDTTTEPEVKTERVYYAVGDDFEEVEAGEGNGWFNIDVESYEYVGEGNGDYTFDPNGGGEDTITVYYSTVLFTGGYTNNNWLATQTLDLDEDEVAKFKIQVDSYTPAQLNEMQANDESGFNELINGADLIVLGAGFDLDVFETEGTPASAEADGLSQYSAASDLSEDVAGAILEATAPENSDTDAIPVLVDGRLCDKTLNEATNLQSLAQTLCEDADKNVAAGVNENVYCYMPGETDRYNLVTADFIKAFGEDQYSESTAPYYDVWYEIDYENFLREQQGGTELLPTDITMANSLRYIINYAGRRVVNNKESITVLDVEPLTQLSNSNNKLKEDTVRSWLPDSVRNTMQIKIVTMSTAEFIGKIEDINEVYDLVYIGASLDNFNTSWQNSGNWPNYNDNDMDGLLYTNIGDTYVSGTRGGYNVLVGMTDDDYTRSNYYPYNVSVKTGAQTFRFSGNDITATKQAELETFAQTGFPVVIANELLKDGLGAVKTTLNVKLESSYDDGKLVLTATPEWSEDIGSRQVTYTYQWKKDGTAISGATTKSWTVREPGTYTCVVTAVVGEQTVSATSPEAWVTNGTWYTATENGNAQKGTYYPVKLTVEEWYGRYTFKATLQGANAQSYQWYQYNNNRNRWEKISNAISQSYTVNRGYSAQYACLITDRNNKEYFSQSINRYNTMQDIEKADYGYDGWWGWIEEGTWDTTKQEFSAKVTPTESELGVTLTGSVDPSTLSGATLKWSNNKTSIALNNLQNGTYWLTVTYNGVTATSAWYTVNKVDNHLRADIATTGTPSNEVELPATKASVNGDRVDNSSILYETMSNILTYDNVMSDAGTGTNSTWTDTQKATLLKYLNLSSPSIELTERPKEYSEDILTNKTVQEQYKKDTLTYTFQIRNPTEATPESTLYTVHLYIDQNADGRHADTEELPELVITDADGNTVAADALKADTVYTVSRTLPDTYAGILPWKLEVVKNGNTGVHASETGYAFRTPDVPVEIKILQISSQNGMTKGTFSLETDEDNRYYHTAYPYGYGGDWNKYYSGDGGYFDKLKQAGLYDISIDVLSVSAINNMTKAKIADTMDDYNMLILGFGDAYGWLESGTSLSEDAAHAVTDYIASGRAVLFTHDTTSFFNMKSENPQAGVGYGGYWYWGYYFNSVIRSAVGLDRYGVTDPVYGLSQYSGLTTNSGIVAKAYDGLNDDLEDKLLGANYSIAYMPKTGRDETVSQTNGYTVFTLQRLTNNTAQKPNNSSGISGEGQSGNGTTTNSVSQVNQGQITTFPYNVNTKAFDSQNNVGETLTVATTHEQYYQLNMNGDDIVVWYCLGGNNYKSYYNDVVNNYYIYNRGNVTYSGAGHSDPTQPDEAKLFVNTMIAAYRAAIVNPEVDFVSAGGDDVEYLYLPMEYSGDAAAQDFSGTIITDASNPAEVCFRIDDPNLDPNKKITVAFYQVTKDAQGNEEETPLGDVTLTTADGAIVTADNTADGAGLKSGTIYTAQLPQSVLDTFGASEDEKMTLGIRVTTIIAEQPYTGTDTIELRKLGLLTLR